MPHAQITLRSILVKKEKQKLRVNWACHIIKGEYANNFYMTRELNLKLIKGPTDQRVWVQVTNGLNHIYIYIKIKWFILLTYLDILNS
jgi:hypothetical protein